ncbi:hypothetical protein QNO07_09285 [Streptomyces sp. 549]|uniref:hypothetical protein n=1 Tax=Streptomyces sp. 549 TaxID=3049076 RepID=UPI0024C2EB73|nr:hypothetical protein [Streptomyces sp. 549]MDK1473611.1 hypothetical protein [Streptomyces sp. 549]
MTAQTVDITDDIRDFTTARKSIRFRVDSDVFDAVPDIPAQTLLDFAMEMEHAGDSPDQAIRAMVKVVDILLTQESAALFKARMSNPDNPISAQQLKDIMPWLLEQYGMRPTEPSSDSPTGPASPEPGTSSTANAPAQASTSAPSP